MGRCFGNVDEAGHEHAEVLCVFCVCIFGKAVPVSVRFFLARFVWRQGRKEVIWGGGGEIHMEVWLCTPAVALIIPYVDPGGFANQTGLFFLLCVAFGDSRLFVRQGMLCTNAVAVGTNFFFSGSADVALKRANAPHVAAKHNYTRGSLQAPSGCVETK